MNIKKGGVGGVAALWAAAALFPLQASADGSGVVATATTEDSWQFEAVPYLYVPWVALTVQLPRGVSSSSDVSPNELLNHIKMGALGAFAVQKGNWGALTDVLFLNVGDAQARTRSFTIGRRELPVDVTASASLDIKTTLWTLAGTYRVLADPLATLDVLAGARALYLTVDERWYLSGNVGPIPLPGRSGGGERSGNQWNGIVGTKARLFIFPDRKWFMPFYADVGTGESKLTWQASTGFGYVFSWGDVSATWRYVDYTNKSGKPIQDLSLSGAQISAAFRW
jgi:hypothetical protein